MTTETTIIGIIIIAICGLSLLLMSRNNKNKKSKMQKTLTDFAQSSGCILAESDSCGNIAIGIDAANSALFFTRKHAGEMLYRKINLTEYSKSYVYDVTRTAGEKGDLRATDRIELVLVAKDKKQDDVRIELYNVEFDSLRLMGENHLAEKWKGFVNNLLAGPKSEK